MSVKATINTITPSPDGTGTGVNWLVDVTFTDTNSTFTQEKTYSFPMGTTQAQGAAAITADATTLKAALATASTLASKVGTVITV